MSHIDILLCLLATLLCTVTATPLERKARLDPSKIMDDVNSLQLMGFNDLEFKISPELYDDVMNQFSRFERDFEKDKSEEIFIPPASEEVEEVEEPSTTLPSFIRPPRIRSWLLRIF